MSLSSIQDLLVKILESTMTLMY